MFSGGMEVKYTNTVKASNFIHWCSARLICAKKHKLGKETDCFFPNIFPKKNSEYKIILISVPF